MPHYTGPLLTRDSADTLRRARDKGAADWQGSLDLGRSQDSVALDADGFHFRGQPYPWPGKLKDRTLYYWDGEDFAPISRYSGSLIKLVPTEWGAPTFEIDGIKMLPTSKLSPFEDARRKVELVAPAGKVILDTCGGLGYFAACALEAGVGQIRSFEKNADVMWLRTLNPWSPDRTRLPPVAACSSATVTSRSRSNRWPATVSTQSCTTRRASASPASCTHRCSTTTSPA